MAIMRYWHPLLILFLALVLKQKRFNSTRYDVKQGVNEFMFSTSTCLDQKDAALNFVPKSCIV